MKILFAAALAGDPAALRLLRFILPAQVAGTFAFTFLADAVGMRNRAGLFAAATAGVSVAGASACALLGWYRARRRPI